MQSFRQTRAALQIGIRYVVDLEYNPSSLVLNKKTVGDLRNAAVECIYPSKGRDLGNVANDLSGSSAGKLAQRVVKIFLNRCQLVSGLMLLTRMVSAGSPPSGRAVRMHM